MKRVQIDPDIRKAKTLPSDFYTSQTYFDLAKERIFGRTWQFVGNAGDVNNLKPVTLLEGLLDEPLLITRQGLKLSCMSNVCTHRGMILVDKPCEGDRIRCGYHGRRFNLDGTFVSMPEFEGVEDFPSDADNLQSVALNKWNTFLFASLEPVSPFEAFVAGSEFAVNETDAAKLSLVSTRDYEVKAHWALYCENYLEGFHIPYVHKSLNEVVDYGTYSTETFRYSSMQTGFDSNGEIAGRYFFMFPNTMLNFYPWGISMNIVRPINADKSVVSFLTYVLDETKLGGGAGADLHRVEMEDEKIVESVQKGIRSRFYTHGRYSPTRETGTHHFHRLIAEFME
ncbi:MAG: SRPBCC family protein [Acidobacteriota bacterium]